MQDLRWNALWELLALILICLVVWAVQDAVYALLVFSSVLIVYIVNQLYWLHELHRWLKKPIINSIPIGSGIWEDIFADLYKQQKSTIKARAQISSELVRFRHAASALPDGVVVLDSIDKIEWCNPAAEAQLGLSLAHDVNQPIYYLLRQEEFTQYLNHKDFSEPIRLKSARNLEMLLEIVLIPFGAKQKLLISRDITKIEKLDHMRRDFIANVSHELRTPLTVVGGFLETMMDMPDGVPDANRGYFEMMIEQTDRMRALIEDLLTLSQLENSPNPQSESQINIKQLVDMIANEGKSISNQRHTISAEIDDSLQLMGAAQELHSAFGNLVTNAIRYTPAGGEIKLYWQLHQNEAVFSVTDTGIGIDQKHLDRLTERFYRVDRSRSRETGGTGLGLSIVKHILTRHQGRLEVTSELGRGSVFSAIFPISRVVRTDNSTI